VGNKAESSNTLRALLRELAKRLPSGWRIVSGDARDRRVSVGLAKASALKIRAPRGGTGSLLVQTKERLEPKDVDVLAANFRSARSAPLVIAAPFLSPRTQERLKASGIGYADLTGNIYLSLAEPGLFVETSGATENPVATPRERKSLKGAKAGRLVRALSDFRPPVGIRELAKRAGIDAGYASRLVDFLDRETLVTRDPRGAISRVDWMALIRRWSEAYSPYERNRVSWHLAPRGIAQAVERLKKESRRYAVSGSWAAAQLSPVAPPRILFCYSDETEDLAHALDVRSVETGANVALVTPFDPVVYERVSEKGGVTITAASQIAADLLRSPGRGPNEAEALMEWMQGNEDTWRR
jgi:hypothetical protein